MPPTMLLTSSPSLRLLGRPLSVLLVSASCQARPSFRSLGCATRLRTSVTKLATTCARASRPHALPSVSVSYSSHCHCRRAQSRKFNTGFTHARTFHQCLDIRPHRRRQTDTHKRHWHTHQRHTHAVNIHHLCHCAWHIIFIYRVCALRRHYHQRQQK